MAYDPSDDQKTDPLKYVSDTVLGRAYAKPTSTKPKTYQQSNRAPGQTDGFSLQDITAKAQQRLAPLAQSVGDYAQTIPGKAADMASALQSKAQPYVDQAGKDLDVEMYERGMEQLSPEDRMASMHTYMKGAAPSDVYAHMDPATVRRMYPNMSPDQAAAYTRAAKGPVPQGPHAPVLKPGQRVDAALTMPQTHRQELDYLENQIRALRAQNTPQARQQAEQLAEMYQQYVGREARTNNIQAVQQRAKAAEDQARAQLAAQETQHTEQVEQAKKQNLTAEQTMDERIDPFIFAQEGTARTKKKGQTAGGVGGMTNRSFAGAMHDLMRRDETSPALQDLAKILGPDVMDHVRREDPTKLQNDRLVTSAIDKIKTPKDPELRERVFKDEVALNHELTGEGIQYLKNHKVPATLGNIYVTHFMGTGPGGAKFIQAAMNPKLAQQNAAKAFPAEAKANPEFFKKGATVKQVYDAVTNTMRKRVMEEGVKNPDDYLKKDYSDLQLKDLPKKTSALTQAEQHVGDAARPVYDLLRLVSGMKDKPPQMESEPVTVTARKPAAPMYKKAAAKNTIKALSAQRARNKTRRD